VAVASALEQTVRQGYCGSVPQAGSLRAQVGGVFPGDRRQLEQDAKAERCDGGNRFGRTGALPDRRQHSDAERRPGRGRHRLAGRVVASHDFASGALVRVLPGWQCPSLPLHHVTPTTRKRAARVLALVDWAYGELLRRLRPHVETRCGERAAHGAGANLEQVACRTAAGSARQSDMGLTVGGGELK
jgi:hypothetical protein